MRFDINGNVSLGLQLLSELFLAADIGHDE
jgi:hypothetical protein